MAEDRLHNLVEKFKQEFNEEPEVVVRAPGRVNLIGEHTDYNEGFVFPVAIDRDIVVAARRRTDDIIRIFSIDFNSMVTFHTSRIEYDPINKWSNYPRGVAKVLQESEYDVCGMDAVFSGNIPQGAGLSSSAALEIAMALTFEKLGGIAIDPVEMALLCQKAENQFVGVNCGIMDQFISRMGKRDHALLLDCRTLDFELVPLNFENIKIVVCNTGVKRGLVDSEYNARREECERGVRILERFLTGIKALRDVSVEDIKKYASYIPDIIEKRCRYVVQENERVLESVKALEERDLMKFGYLMNQSHIGLRDDYQVSCPELDIMVEIAWSIDGVLGSRMTGAGFGGCTVSLVIEDALPQLIEKINTEYPTKTGLMPDIYICSAEDGAGTIDWKGDNNECS